MLESVGFEDQLDWGREEWQKEREQERGWGRGVVWQGIASGFLIWEAGMEAECILTSLTRREIWKEEQVLWRKQWVVCWLRSISRKIQSKGTEVWYSPPLKCSCFLWKKAEYEGQSNQIISQFIITNVWIWSELRCLPLRVSNASSSTYTEPSFLVYLSAYLLTANLATGRYRGHYFQFVDEKPRHREFKRLAWNHI